MVRSTIILAGWVCAVIGVSQALAQTQTQTQTQPPSEPPALGVYPVYANKALEPTFKATKIDPQELVRQIEESVRATRRFRLIERDQDVMTKSIFVEQEMDAVKNAQSAKDLKFPADIDYLIQPIVVSFNLAVRKEPREEDPNKFRYTCSGTAAVTIKLLNPERDIRDKPEKDDKSKAITKSGEIKYQTTRETVLKASANACRNIATNDDTAAYVETWRVMSKDLAQKITNATVGYLFPILVIQVRGEDIFVNRGEGAGINLGEVYQLFSVGEELIDPVSKESLGSEEIHLGEVKITRVNPKFSIARAEGKPLKEKPKPNDVLRDSESGDEKDAVKDQPVKR